MNPMPGQPESHPGVMGREYRRGRDLHLDHLVQLSGELMLERIIYERKERGINFIFIRQIAYYMIGLVVGEERSARQLLELCPSSLTLSSSLPDPPRFFGGFTPEKVLDLAREITEYLGFPCCQDQITESILNKLDEVHDLATSP